MKIFLDTADRTAIKKWKPSGLIDGVTTNPTLLSKEDPNSRQVLEDICSILPQGDISFEVVEHEPSAVYQQAKEIAAISPNIVVKIACKPEYLPIINMLCKENIKVNVTLVFSVLQALAVAKLGVTYISPFIGRLEDIGTDGIGLIDDLVELVKLYEFDSEILAASIRTVGQWQEIALLGPDACTLPPEVFEKALLHPLTDIGFKKFDDDWKSLGKKSLLD